MLGALDQAVRQFDARVVEFRRRIELGHPHDLDKAMMGISNMDRDSFRKRGIALLYTVLKLGVRLQATAIYLLFHKMYIRRVPTS